MCALIQPGRNAVAPALLSARILDATGTTEHEQRIEPGSGTLRDARGRRHLEIPITTLQPGRYLLEVQAELRHSSGPGIRRQVPFSVVR